MKNPWTRFDFFPCFLRLSFIVFGSFWIHMRYVLVRCDAMTVHVWPNKYVQTIFNLPPPRKQQIVPQCGYYCPKFDSSFGKLYTTNFFRSSIEFWPKHKMPSSLSWQKAVKQWANIAHNVYQLFSLIYLEQIFENSRTRTVENGNSNRVER